MEKSKQKFRFAWSYRLFQCSLFFSVFVLGVLIAEEHLSSESEAQLEIPAEIQYVVAKADRLILPR